MEQAIVHTEVIKRMGELKYFQIALPGTTKKVVGVEISAFVFSALPADPPLPPPPVNNNCPNPGIATITQLSTDTNGGTRNQTFQIGAAVNPGFKYSLTVFSVSITLTALAGDDYITIGARFTNAINATSLATWNQYGQNTNNFKPSAVFSGGTITTSVDLQHNFTESAEGSCTGFMPLQYDPLFWFRNNRKAGKLSLQSPDVTDIFCQSEIFYEDKNIGFADYTINPLSAGEWFRGKKRIATEVLVSTTSPILEAYYKDSLGQLAGQDLQYQLNIYVWIEKSKT